MRSLYSCLSELACLMTSDTVTVQTSDNAVPKYNEGKFEESAVVQT